MILVLEEKEANDHMSQDNNIPIMYMKFLEKPEAIEMIKRIFYIERKMEYVRGIDLESHKVIDMWEKMNFKDEEGFKIVKSLSKRRSLIDIANDMESRLKRNLISSNPQSHIEIDTFKLSQTVLIQMDRSGEKLLNDLIFFLTICPSGLILPEIEILLNMLPSELSIEAKQEKIKQIIDLLKEISVHGDQTCAYGKQSDGSVESLERIEIIRELIQNLLFVELEEEPSSEIRVKINDNEKPALEFIIKSNSQINQSIANVSSTQLLKYVMEFFLSYSKYLLYKIRDVRSDG